MLSIRSTRTRRLFRVLAFTLVVTPVLATATYTVKSGDTLEQIAHRLSIPQTELVRLNHIDDADTLSLGQELKLPTPAKAHKSAKTTEAKSTSVKSEKSSSNVKDVNPRELARERTALLTKGKKVVTQAETMLGTPYVWGGSGSRGVDCSGFVLKTMREALGKIVPHHAADLFNMGLPISYNQLQPGDLVFFNTTGDGVSHVGIWLGNNSFIHASSKHGVQQQKLTGYYAKNLVGARRLH